MSKDKITNQSLPVWLRILSDEQILQLASYKHNSSKTPYEAFMASGPLAWAERQLPAFMSPNFITILGSIPLQGLVIYTLLT